MIVELADWQFQVDVEDTRAKTTANSMDHCMCAYCRNFYETVETAYPYLPSFLTQFGVNIAGPSELMPFEPTYMLVCYRVTGQILHWGTAPIYAEDVQVSVGAGEEGTFLLWVGELELPWIQNEDVEDVVSPANLPEFMERMEQMWALRHGEELICS